MIDYNPRAWFRVTFSIHGTILSRVAARLVETGVYTAILCGLYTWLEYEYAIDIPDLNPTMHSFMGIAVGMLLVFRNNSSYDRHWEGRKLWGSIINTARNLMRGAAVYVGKVPELADLVTAYALALKQHLRNRQDFEEIRHLVPEPMLTAARSTSNVPNALAYFMSAWIHQHRVTGALDPMQARTLETYVAGLLDCQGGCERIQRTPIPFAYACHIKQFLMIYLGTLPFVVIPLMGWLSVPAVVVIAFGLYGIEEVGIEMEDPFADDPNDLPLDRFCETIAQDSVTLGNLPGMPPGN